MSLENAIIPLLLSIKNAAKLLGISERTLWTLTHEKHLPHVRVGRRLLFSRATLESRIAQQEACK